MIFSEKLMATDEFKSTQDLIKTELKRLKDHEIPYDYKLCGSKMYAIVKLTNKKKLMVDPYRRTIVYRSKVYKYKYLERWIDKNKLEVSYE